MLRRRVIKNLLLMGAIGSSVIGWEYFQIAKTPNWNLLRTHADLLAELTETILPASDTPGAKAAGVPAFVQHMVEKSLDIKSQNNFINGLQELSEYSQSKFGKSFEQCTLDEKGNILAQFEESSHSFNSLTTKARHLLTGKPFFSILHDFTIIGYCTSELGATQGFAYDHIPGSFKGCLPYTAGQKAWATK